MYTSQVLKSVLVKQYPEVQTGKFREKVVEYMKGRLEESEWPLMEREAIDLLRGVPDAFALNADGVVIFEIEVYHPVHKRLERVLDIMDFFDQWEIELEILTVDAYGRIAPLDQTQLMVHNIPVK